MSNWHQREVPDVLQEFAVDPERGLTDEDVSRRWAEHGPNELAEARGRGPWRILWDQMREAMVLLLIVAAGISLYLGEHVDTGVILAIVVLNAALGFFQEYRAERALVALKEMAVPTVKVLRGGAPHTLSARDVVPGDIVLLEMGSVVPADGRLIEVHALKINEAALTGESEAVEKHPDPLPDEDLPVADRRNTAHRGTLVNYGRGTMVVTATGMQTELGRIAGLLQEMEPGRTPLQQRLGQLGRQLAVAALVVVGLVFGLGMLEGRDWRQMLMTGISLAVAAVPEGLPAVATITLALGAQRLYRLHALIRNLPAVETLGSVTVICSDKTGTLTQGQLTVTVLRTTDETLDLSERLGRGEEFLEPGAGIPENLADRSSLALLLAGGGLANDASLDEEALAKGRLRGMGDPTDSSMLIVAARFGLNKKALDEAFERVDEVPFDAARKRVTTVHRLTDGGPPRIAQVKEVVERILRQEGCELVAFCKGSPDGLLEISDRVWADGELRPLDDSWRTRITEANEELAARGMRVLGVAFRPLGPGDKKKPEQKLVFAGMMGMIDPPRPEVPEAVARCRSAGIRPVMITGDHALTARHIAGEIGLAEDGEVLSGREMEHISDKALSEKIGHVSVFARVSPEHKVRIVEAFKRRGEVIAVTGDGVNDAPALKKADIGVAMGGIGTDVTKEASEMVLMDDNFATIVGAVEQGRIIFDNIRKFVKYILLSNVGELWVMLLPSLLAVIAAGHFAGMPLPLLPLQILWINLVTDGPPALALAVEPAERETMRRPPLAPERRIVDRSIAFQIIGFGLLMGTVAFLLGWWFREPTLEGEAARQNTARWRTMVFTVVALSQMGNALAVRSSRDSLFTIGLLTNKWLLGAVALTFGLQLAVLYVPFLAAVFQTAPLSAADLGLCLALSTVVFWAIEGYKWLMREYESKE